MSSPPCSSRRCITGRRTAEPGAEGNQHARAPRRGATGCRLRRPGAWRGSDLQGANGGTRSRSDSTVREVIAKYRAWFLQQPDLMAALPCSGRSNPLLSISREPATKTGRAEGLKFAGSRNARDVLERAPVALSPRCADHAANVRRCAMLVRGKSWARTTPGARLLIASQGRHSVCSRTPHACTRTAEAGRSVHRTKLASPPMC